ncbi:META domain-containing protein [Sphingobacterium sp. Mn56C]|uniref:META domain-containing protein n=1 Tax=Sphingobacterium sp. Mn56C TaxID=3395261 RepID=UPI003BC15409
MKHISIFFALFAVVLLSACATKRNSNTQTLTNLEDVFYGTSWQIKELDGKIVAEKVNGKEAFMSFDKYASSYTASGGCNGLAGTFELKPNLSIKFYQGMSTMMACEDMDVENSFKNVLTSTTHIDVTDSVLTFLNRVNKPIAKFMPRKVATERLSLEGNWTLDYLNAVDLELKKNFPGKMPTLNFHMDNRKITGNTGCNNYFGHVKTDENFISFENIGATKKYCEGYGPGEALYLEQLEKVNNYILSENFLQLMAGNTTLMRFTK